MNNILFRCLSTVLMNEKIYKKYIKNLGHLDQKMFATISKSYQKRGRKNLRKKISCPKDKRSLRNKCCCLFDYIPIFTHLFIFTVDTFRVISASKFLIPRDFSGLLLMDHVWNFVVPFASQA